MHKGIDELYNNEQLKAIDNLMKTVPTTYLSEISKSVSNIVIPDYSVTKSSDMISETTKALTDLAVMSSKSSMGVLTETMHMLGNMAPPSLEIVQQVADLTKNIVLESLDKLKFEMPKIPTVSPETLDRWEFMDIVSECKLPVFFETDTELQDQILEICKYAGDKYPRQEVEECVINYYDDNRIETILNNWNSQEWIELERKEGFSEALQGYKLQRYWSTTCILMTQIGGVIKRLYDVTNMNCLIPKSEKKELLDLYRIRKDNSEKAKGIIMICMQEHGIYGWDRFAEYFVNVVYSNKEDLTDFVFNPERNKTCHGDQLNAGQQLVALKYILILNMIIQMSEELFDNIVGL